MFDTLLTGAVSFQHTVPLRCAILYYLSPPLAIAIKESAHVGDKAQKRLAKGVDDLGTVYLFVSHKSTFVSQILTLDSK